MHTHTAKTVIYMADDEREVEVEYTVYPAYRGYRDSLGVPVEPDEPESVEIETVTMDGIDITGILDDDQFAEIEGRLL